MKFLNLQFYYEIFVFFHPNTSQYGHANTSEKKKVKAPSSNVHQSENNLQDILTKDSISDDSSCSFVL